MKKQILIFTLSFFLPFLFSESVKLNYTFSDKYTITERSDWSKYENGKYIGLLSREMYSRMKPLEKDNQGTKFSGNFYLFEETKHNMRNVSKKVKEIAETEFIIKKDGSMTFIKDSGYPPFRGVPSFPSSVIKSGEQWISEGIRVVDPKGDGKKTYVPVLVSYEFIGKEIYKERDVFRIKGKFATRLNLSKRFESDDETLVSASGTHDLQILLDAKTCLPFMITDHLDETYNYEDGYSVRYKGNTAIFMEIPVPVREDIIITEINKNNRKKDIPSSKDFDFEKTDKGLKLSISDIKFKSDSDEILPEEKERLDKIARTLLTVEDGRFLIEGHTASTGQPENEMELSILRAKKIADELSKRGLKPEQFMYLGHGSTKPVADNSTKEGMARNRRVEITILE